MNTRITYRQSPMHAGFTAIELCVVLGIMLMLAGMTTPTVLKMLRQSAVHEAGGEIINAWRVAHALAVEQVTLDTPNTTLKYYGIEIVQTPGQQAYAAVIYDNQATSTIAGNPAGSLYMGPTTSQPVAKYLLKRTVLIASGMAGADPTPLNGVMVIYAQYGTGVPIDPTVVASGGGGTACPVGIGIPGNTVSNIPASTISTHLRIQTVDYTPGPTPRGYAVDLALYPVGIFAELN
jgi:Tfp pilus assembly protein FimT